MRVFRGVPVKERGTGSRVTPNSYKVEIDAGMVTLRQPGTRVSARQQRYTHDMGTLAPSLAWHGLAWPGRAWPGQARRGRGGKKQADCMVS